MRCGVQGFHEMWGYTLQEYLAHKKAGLSQTLQEDHARGTLVALGGGAISYARGSPVCNTVGYWVQGYLAHKKQPPTLGLP